MSRRYVKHRLVSWLPLAAYATALTVFLAVWVLSYYRATGIETGYAVRQEGDLWFVSHVGVAAERGVFAVDRWRWLDYSKDADWVQGQRKWEFHADPLSETDSLLPPSFTYDESPFWNRWGLGYLSFGSFEPQSDGGEAALFMPAWLLLPALLAPMSWWIYRRQARARRRRRGLCVYCGYNLAGNTSGVCPECGGEPEGAKS